MNELELFKQHMSKRVDFLPEELEEITSAFVLKKIKKKQYIIQKDRKIRVNTLSPGAIDTPIFSLQFDTPEGIAAAKNLFASIAPLGRVGYADEIASAALFLASEDSSYSTGIDLIADGGITSV